MTNQAAPTLNLGSPFAWTGRQALTTITYVGGMTLLATSALRVAFDRSMSRAAADSFLAELGWMLRLGLPLVALVHVGIGSFLSMQSYFGGTFVDGTGAVVGVGLIRNVAPMMACLTLAGLLAARITPELRAWRRGQESPRAERPGFLERTASGHIPSPVLPAGSPAGLVAPRLLAAMVSGLVFSLWGSAVGVLVGWQVGQTMMGVSTHSFFLMFWEMLWVRDVVGLIVKGMVFGLVAATFACHEGLRGATDDGFDAVATSACRAVCLSAVAILMINSGWFILVYHAGPAFGPTLMAPPSS